MNLLIYLLLVMDLVQNSMFLSEREETILMIRALKQKMHIGTSIANLHCGHIMHKMETLVKVCH